MKKKCPKNRPIGVFDSGIGGLTVVKEIRQLLPREDILYFGDTARLPYGTKSAELIKRYALEDANFLYERDVKIIVCACHSASSWALAEIKRAYPIPVIGVLEAGARAAIKATKNGKIGVIGTRATIASDAYERALKRINYEHGLNRAIEIVAKPTPLFVPLVEEGFIDHPITRAVAREYLKIFPKEGIDTLLLGCTHYPILKSVICRILNKGIKVIDASYETAAMVKDILQRKDWQKETGRGSLKIYLSDITPEFEKIAEQFLEEKPKVILRASLKEKITIKE